MSTVDAVAILSGILVSISIVGAFVSRALRRWIKEQLIELRPNGGGSTYDLVRTIARDLEVLGKRVSSIEQFIVTSKAPIRIKKPLK